MLVVQGEAWSECLLTGSTSRRRFATKTETAHSRITWTYATHSVAKHNTHTRLFNGPFSGTTRVRRYQKGKTDVDFTEARDSEWQWHQLGHMQVCTSLQIHNHASTPALCFLPAGRPSCRPTKCVKALKTLVKYNTMGHIIFQWNQGLKPKFNLSS